MSPTEEEERREEILTIAGVRYFNATQAADYLGVSRRTFYKRYHPYLTPVKLPNYERIYYTQTDLDKVK